MTPDQESLITRLIGENASRDAIKRELISQGYATSGFDETYARLLKELHKEEPKLVQKPPSFARLSETGTFQKQALQHRRQLPISVVISKTLKGVLVIALFILCGYLLYHSGFFEQYLAPVFSRFGTAPSSTSSDLSPSDFYWKERVGLMSQSARLYATRMGGIEGVCKDIIVTDPLRCTESAKGYAIYVALSNDKFYCEDSTNFADMLSALPVQPGRCQ